MKRMMFRFSVALIAFCVGVGCELASKKFYATTCVVVSDSFTNQSKHFPRVNSIPPLELSDAPIPAGSLPRVLERIDEKYKKQCQLPTNWDGDWHTVKQLAEFRTCNERWATARRKAIQSEIANYLVQY